LALGLVIQPQALQGRLLKILYNSQNFTSSSPPPISLFTEKKKEGKEGKEKKKMENSNHNTSITTSTMIIEEPFKHIVVFLKGSLTFGKETQMRDCLKACGHLAKVCPPPPELIPLMVDLVAVHGVNKLLLDLCLNLLENGQKEDGDLSLLGDVVVGVMIKNEMDKLIQGKGLLALNRLFKKGVRLTPQIALAIVKGGWHRPQRADLIGRLASTAERRMILVKTPGVVDLLALAQRDKDGLKPTLLALMNLSYQCKVGKALLVRGGCIRIIVRAMQQGPHMEWAQVLCLKVLANLMVYPINRALLREMNFSSIIQIIRRLHPHSQELQGVAVQALRELAPPLKKNKPLLV
jgi:hypothetical protein